MAQHGTIAAYRRGCHCPKCRAANAAYMRAWYAAHPDKAAAASRTRYAAHKAEILATQRAYYLAHRDKILARVNADRRANPEKIAARKRAYYVAHKKEISAVQRAYYVANAERITVRGRAYYVAHRDRAAAHARKRIRFLGKKVTLPTPPRTGVCADCGRSVGNGIKVTHMHHEQYDPSDPLKHTVELCVRCHLKKRHGTTGARRRS